MHKIQTSRLHKWMYFCKFLWRIRHSASNNMDISANISCRFFKWIICLVSKCTICGNNRRQFSFPYWIGCRTEYSAKMYISVNVPSVLQVFVTIAGTTNLFGIMQVPIFFGVKSSVNIIFSPPFFVILLMINMIYQI